MLRLPAILLSLCAPVLCAGQVAPDVSAAAGLQPLLSDQLLEMQARNPTLDNLQAMPLWGTPDGRVLAIVGFADNTIPSKPQSPQIGSAADWKFVDVTNFVSTGLLFDLNRNARAYATIGTGAVLSPLYAAATAPCAERLSPLRPDSACFGRATLARTGALQIGTDWSLYENVDLELNYGLAWLRHADAPASALPSIDIFGAIGNSQFPTLLMPGLEIADVQNAGVSAIGHWRLDGAGTFDLGASLNRLQLYAPNTPPLTSLNQAAVSFGLRHGSFSGVVTGRVLGQAETFNSSPRWAGLDIGFSWRTPWQGELSFGTQNLWSSGALPNLVEPGSREVESNQARVPYVQYHQDL